MPKFKEKKIHTTYFCFRATRCESNRDVLRWKVFFEPKTPKKGKFKILFSSSFWNLRDLGSNYIVDIYLFVAQVSEKNADRYEICKVGDCESHFICHNTHILSSKVVPRRCRIKSCSVKKNTIEVCDIFTKFL